MQVKIKTARRIYFNSGRLYHPAPITQFERVRSAYCWRSPLQWRAYPIRWKGYINANKNKEV
jgi:hypothetical protein